MLVTDLRRDFVRSLFSRLADAPFDAFDKIFDEMQEKGRADIKAAAPHAVDIVVKHAADMRYIGQEHAVTVELAGELFQTRRYRRHHARFDAVAIECATDMRRLTRAPRSSACVFRSPA